MNQVLRKLKLSFWAKPVPFYLWSVGREDLYWAQFRDSLETAIENPSSNDFSEIFLDYLYMRSVHPSSEHWTPLMKNLKTFNTPESLRNLLEIINRPYWPLSQIVIPGHNTGRIFHPSRGPFFLGNFSQAGALIRWTGSQATYSSCRWDKENLYIVPDGVKPQTMNADRSYQFVCRSWPSMVAFCWIMNDKQCIQVEHI